MPQRRSFLLLFIAAGLGSCAYSTSEPAADEFRAADYIAPEPGATLLLLHRPAAESAYQSGDPVVLQAVQEELKRSGWNVALVSNEDYEVAFKAERFELSRRFSAPSRTDLATAEFKALSLVASVACASTGSPLLVRTRLLNRPTVIERSHASWDGVRREVKPADGRAVYVHGTGPGISVELVAVSPKGKLLIKSYGGLSLPYDAAASGATLLPRVNPLADADEIRQGVAVASRYLAGI